MLILAPAVAKISQFRPLPVAEAFIKMLKELAADLTDSVFTDKRFYKPLK